MWVFLIRGPLLIFKQRLHSQFSRNLLKKKFGPLMKILGLLMLKISIEIRVKLFDIPTRGSKNATLAKLY